MSFISPSTWCILSSELPVNQTLILVIWIMMVNQSINHHVSLVNQSPSWFISKIRVSDSEVLTKYITSSRYPWAKWKWRTSPTALKWEQKGRPGPQQWPSLSVPSKDMYTRQVKVQSLCTWVKVQTQKKATRHVLVLKKVYLKYNHFYRPKSIALARL